MKKYENNAFFIIEKLKILFESLSSDAALPSSHSHKRTVIKNIPQKVLRKHANIVSFIETVISNRLCYLMKNISKCYNIKIKADLIWRIKSFHLPIQIYVSNNRLFSFVII